MHALLSESLSLFAPYFKLISSSKRIRHSRESKLVAEAAICAATKVLSSLGFLLKTLFESDNEANLNSAHVEGFRSILDAMLPHILAIGQHFVSTDDDHGIITLALDAFFGRLANGVVVPVVCAFWHLSVQSYSSILQRAKPGKKTGSQTSDEATSDPRVNLMKLLQSVLSFCGTATVLKQSRWFLEVTLCSSLKELVKAIESLGATNDRMTRLDCPWANAGSTDRKGCTLRLARKDVVWYLSSIATSCLSVIQPDPMDACVICLEVDVTLTRILSCLSQDYCSPHDPNLHTCMLSEIERSLLLALVECVSISNLLPIRRGPSSTI